MELWALLASMGGAGLALFAITGEWERMLERRMIAQIGPLQAAVSGFKSLWPEARGFEVGPASFDEHAISVELPNWGTYSIGWDAWARRLHGAEELPLSYPFLRIWNAARHEPVPGGKIGIYSSFQTEESDRLVALSDIHPHVCVFFGSAFQLRWARRLRGASIAMMVIGAIGAAGLALA